MFLLLAATSGPFAIAVQADIFPDQVMNQVHLAYPEIPSGALQKAFSYYEEHPAEITNKNYMTIIDFDQPSTNHRMYVIDMNSAAVSPYFVAHGINSGDLYAEYFSNVDGSLMSSLGLYLTGEQYIGVNGLSMRLLGEEESNSNAYARDIVLHGATYVSQAFIDSTGRLGRSEGCTAVEVQYAPLLVNELENGSVYLIYKN